MNSPVEVLTLGADADRYVDAVALVPIDTGEVSREHVTLRSGTTYERVCVGAADAVVWVNLSA